MNRHEIHEKLTYFNNMKMNYHEQLEKCYKEDDMKGLIHYGKLIDEVRDNINYLYKKLDELEEEGE